MKFFRPLLAAALILSGGIAATLMAQQDAAPAPAAPAAAVETPERYPMPPIGEFPIIGHAEIEKIVATHGHRLLVVNFWATWCGPCVKELPYFQSAFDRYKDQGLFMIGLNMDMPIYEDDWVEYVPESVRENKLTYPHFVINVDPEVTVPWFSQRWMGAIPATFFYDREGQKVGEFIGELTRDELYELVEQMLEKTKEEEAAPAE